MTNYTDLIRRLENGDSFKESQVRMHAWQAAEALKELIAIAIAKESALPSPTRPAPPMPATKPSMKESIDPILIAWVETLLELDDAKAFAPPGLSGVAKTLLGQVKSALAKNQAERLKELK